MKNIAFVLVLASLSACKFSDIIGGGGSKPEEPAKREEFHPCPYMVDGVNHPNCPKSGSAKGGICMPSGEFHSVADKCDKI